MLAGAAAWAGAGALLAQTHKVAAPEKVVRAVGVYEWTGEFAHPSANRFIPVSLYINGSLEDAAIFLAQPVPFALLTGDEYLLEEAGITHGELAIESTARRQTADERFTDGWIGYGKVTPLAPAPGTALARGGAPPAPARTHGIEVSGGSGRPHFSNAGGSAPATTGGTGSAGGGATGSAGSGTAKTGSAGSGSATPAPGTTDDRPRLVRRPGGGEEQSSTADTPEPPPAATGTAPAASSSHGTPDSGAGTASSGGRDTGSDRPTLSRPDQTGQGSSGGTAKTQSGTAAGTGSGQDRSGDSKADDADRPTLRRRTPEQEKEARKSRGESTASVTAVGGPEDDPDRPHLHRGNAGGAGERSTPKLEGLPGDLQQMVGVSDAATREPHNFSRPWANDAERASILSAMQGMAATHLTAYSRREGEETAALEAKGRRSSAAGTTAAPPRRHTGATTGANSRHAVSGQGAPAGQKPAPLDTPTAERLRGFQLAYGALPTYVYTASVPGHDGETRYVTVVAQQMPTGDLREALGSVTDARHLDRTPWMRLVDAVDAEASHRASLLFELRGNGVREFALYRVLGARADQQFVTGTTE